MSYKPQPGDRVGVMDEGLFRLRAIMEQATGKPAPPNNIGTVESIEDGLVYINFDSEEGEGMGNQAPYPTKDVFLYGSTGSGGIADEPPPKPKPSNGFVRDGLTTSTLRADSTSSAKSSVRYGERSSRWATALGAKHWSILLRRRRSWSFVRWRLQRPLASILRMR